MVEVLVRRIVQRDAQVVNRILPLEIQTGRRLQVLLVELLRVALEQLVIDLHVEQISSDGQIERHSAVRILECVQ